MPVDDAPDDDSVRTTYNFAPNSNGLIYRARTSDRGASPDEENQNEAPEDGPSPKRRKTTHTPTTSQSSPTEHTGEATYILQSARWGLIPFWTKRAPDYSSQLRTINCRDDSLAQSGGMWNTMKQRKRCIVIAEGFYEWLKNPRSGTKVPHYVKRKDGKLLLMAGLWDCVQYEGAEEKVYTYTVITTESNKQLSFLHDRMPVVLEAGSEGMREWLDPKGVGWTRELQSLLKPFEGELEVYPVDQGVGKVGNNSPSFVVPVDSKENKKNIANFFGKAQARVEAKQEAKREELEVKTEQLEAKTEEGENVVTSKVEDPESNAPLPKLESEPDADIEEAIRRSTSEQEPSQPEIKREDDALDGRSALAEVEHETLATPSPTKSSKPKLKPVTGKRSRDALSNGTVGREVKKRERPITAFFGK